MSIEIPIIELEGLIEGRADALSRVARELRQPCEELGVFHIVGHTIPAQELAEFEAAMRRLFAIPEEDLESIRRSRDNAWGYYDRELTKNRPDWKQVFDYGADRDPNDPATAHSDGCNRWPDKILDSKPILLRHYASCERVGLALLRAIATSLDLTPDRLGEFFGNHSSFVRLNYYAQCEDPAPPDTGLFPEHGRLGVHHHSDAGAITLLYQDEVAGLQVLADGQFTIVEPVKGALTVNLGDMLQVWSNDRYRSPVHRVLANGEQERYSAPFFLNPNYDAVCEPLGEASSGLLSPRFRPISWAHFRDQRSAGDFANYGAEVQIEDYRIDAAKPDAINRDDDRESRFR